MRQVVCILQRADLFETASEYPAGFRYVPELISRAEERRLVEHLQRLEFKPFEFQGFLGKRRVVSFGWRYDFNGSGLTKTDDMPEFLLPLRERAAGFARLRPTDLQQVLLTEYRPDAPIGWHDRSIFGDVIGISLMSACTFRFRRKAGAAWERSSIVLAPRSAYLLHGPSRTEWEHSIPPVTELRYSITFRNFRDGASTRGNGPNPDSGA